MSKHSKIYITINNIIGEKRTNLTYLIRSSKITVIDVFTDNIQCNITEKPLMIDSIPPGNEKHLLSRIYTTRELITTLEGVIELTRLENDNKRISWWTLQ